MPPDALLRPRPGIGQDAVRRLHATCVEIDATGVLLLGPSGSGKSDLALRLIDAGAHLVADDQVLVERRGERLLGHAEDRLAGLIEVRGIGILRLQHHGPVPIGLVAELAPGETLARLPDPRTHEILGVALPLVRLDPRPPSACAKIRLALRAERVA